MSLTCKVYWLLIKTIIVKRLIYKLHTLSSLLKLNIVLCYIRTDVYMEDSHSHSNTTLKQIRLNIGSLHLRFLVRVVLSSVFDSIKIFLRSHPYTVLLPAVIKVLATDAD